MRSQYPVRYDVPKIIETFGGRAKVFDIFQEMESGVKLRTIDKWLQRKAIPTDALAVLTLYAARGGLEFDLSNFLLEEL